MEKNIQSESRLTFLEATGVIIGHGVGAGILTVPYLASMNNIGMFFLICVIAFICNLLMHLMIAELSYNHDGAQFVKCFQDEFFKGRFGKVLTTIAFILLGFSVIMNCCSYITGSALVFESLFGINHYLAVIGYFVISALVVFFGMKLVGICEKYCAFAMFAVVIILAIAVFLKPLNPLPTAFTNFQNILALYGIISFALSAVISVPTVVKGVNGDRKLTILSITCGIGVNIVLVIILTLITLIGCGQDITEDGALIDLSKKLGGWVGIVGNIFSLLALSTSFWANTLGLRDTMHEFAPKLPLKLCWLFVSLPCLLIVLIFGSSFTKLALIASAVQIATGLGIVIAYGLSRKKALKQARLQQELDMDQTNEKDYIKKGSPILGKYGMLIFQILVIVSSLVATIGSVLGASK